MSEPTRNDELPGDFSFKIADANETIFDDQDMVSRSTGLISIGIAVVLLALLFFTAISLHAKLQLFIGIIAVGAAIYNRRVYWGAEMGESYLDSYDAYTFEEESGTYIQLGRFAKWRRLILSIGEPPNPEFHETSGEEPSRSVASVRTLVEWILIGIGVIIAARDYWRYYFSADGPFFHDIWGHYMIILFLGSCFWFVLWCKHRMAEEWEDLNAHVEALNFFVCRWLMGYVCIWFCIIMILAIDN